MLRLNALRGLSTKTLFSTTAKKFCSTQIGVNGNKFYDKILIANRGEIACRVMRTAKKFGIKTVAIYSEADARSMHVRLADEAYCVGGNLSSESYLQMERIIDVAKKANVQGIHPGYGFLSENSKFVDMVEGAGIAFIGPSGSAMNDMGDKIHSKQIAKDAGCSVVPGYEGEVADVNMAAELATGIGYPVMLKASAGGGGKGMRVAYDEADLREKYQACINEAMSSFGDDRMLIERFIEDPHHIEIQVIADSHGNVAAFPERECSVQRRNQKVVEEAPSCMIDPETRQKMQEEAIALCKAVGYRSAGTVEMLCDKNKNFYFLEMNTRLQVEHPITEMISGEDLVELMFRVGAGEKLPQRFLDSPFVPFHGWAMESRVYAEDPLRNFLPSIGPLNTYKEPPLHCNIEEGGTSVRIDTGVFEGGVISMYYDPMIAKLCTYAKTRDESLCLMEGALDQYVIKGLGNNLMFLRDIMRNKNFRDGNYGTGFIPQEYPDGFLGVSLVPSEAHELIASTAAMYLAKMDLRASEDQEDYGDDLETCDMVVVMGGVEGKAYAVTTEKTYGEGTLRVNIAPLGSDESSAGTTVNISSLDWSPENVLARVAFSHARTDETAVFSDSLNKYAWNSEYYDEEGSVELIQVQGRSTEGYLLRYKGSEHEMLVRSPREHALSTHMLAPEKKDFSNMLLCPMPGTLVSISVEAGDAVVEGQAIAVVEAMKMQNILRAEKKGVVKVVNCAAGATLKTDEVIVVYEGDDDEE